MVVLPVQCPAISRAIELVAICYKVRETSMMLASFQISHKDRRNLREDCLRSSSVAANTGGDSVLVLRLPFRPFGLHGMHIPFLLLIPGPGTDPSRKSAPASLMVRSLSLQLLSPCRSSSTKLRMARSFCTCCVFTVTRCSGTSYLMKNVVVCGVRAGTGVGQKARQLMRDIG